jgi:MFS family permease
VLSIEDRQGMKKALIILAIVGGYSVADMALLFGILVPTYYVSNSNFRQMALLWGQLLTIPGLALVFSLLIHGPHNWSRRLVAFIALGVVIGPALAASFLAVVFLAAFTMDLAYSISSLLILIVLLGLVAIIFLGIRSSAKIAGKRSIQLESANWLAERRQGRAPGERHWRRRGIRWAAWIPSLTVLAVFLFLPETWGLASHLVHPRAVIVHGYKIPVPLTWVTLYAYQGSNGTSTGGIAGRGLGFGVKPYLRSNFPLSTWNVRTERWRETDSEVRRRKQRQQIAQRVFPVGGEELMCVEYRPPDVRSVGASALSFIECTGPIYAHFVGEKVHVAPFYRMLEGMTRAR